MAHGGLGIEATWASCLVPGDLAWWVSFRSRSLGMVLRCTRKCSQFALVLVLVQHRPQCSTVRFLRRFQASRRSFMLGICIEKGVRKKLSSILCYSIG